jgi:quinol monooxygenase YgiN
MLQLAHRNFIPRNTRIIVPSNAGVNLISPHWRCRVVHKQISVIAHLGVAVMVAASGSREALAQITMTGSESAAISQIQMLPGHEAEVRKSVEAVRASTLQDPGCLIFSYDLDATLYEVFRSREALTQHSNAPATKEFLSELKGRVVGDAPVVTLLQQMPGAGHRGARQHWRPSIEPGSHDAARHGPRGSNGARRRCGGTIL